MKLTKPLLLGLFISLFCCASACAEKDTLRAYSGELNGIPLKVGLVWVSTSDVVGYLERLDGQQMVLRLSGENTMEGSLTLYAAQQKQNEGVMTLTKSAIGDTIRWEGTMKFNDGTSLPIWFSRTK